MQGQKLGEPAPRKSKGMCLCCGTTGWQWLNALPQVTSFNFFFVRQKVYHQLTSSENTNLVDTIAGGDFLN